MLVELAAFVKVSHVADVAGSAGKKIGVDRKNNLGVFRAVDRVDVTSESEFCALARAVSDGRFPLMPFRQGIKGQNILQIRGERGRVDDSREDAEPLASRGPQRARERLRRVQELRPGLNLAGFGYRLRAIGIVKVQDGSLRKRIRSAKARRMVGIPFDLGWSPFMTLHEQANGVGAERHGGRIELRLTGSYTIGLLDVRNDILFRRTSAAGKARERQGRGHQP